MTDKSYKMVDNDRKTSLIRHIHYYIVNFHLLYIYHFESFPIICSIISVCVDPMVYTECKITCPELCHYETHTSNCTETRSCEEGELIMFINEKLPHLIHGCSCHGNHQMVFSFQSYYLLSDFIKRNKTLSNIVKW